MANNPIPDQSEEFKRSGMRLITDPASDVLLRRGKTNIDLNRAYESSEDDGSLRKS